MNLPNVKWEWTIPNVLSLVRIALLPVFAVLYLKSDAQPILLWWAGAILVLSGLTVCKLQSCSFLFGQS